jgi:hypothetical protein
MREQHLSDEAVAAFADDVLTGLARDRARRHTAACLECNHAVAVQREAVWALRAAPAPSLPLGLLDRLRDVPVTTPIRHVPTHVDEHGTTMFATIAAPAAFVPQHAGTSRRGRGVTLAVASAAVLGVLATSAASDRTPSAVSRPAGAAHPQVSVLRADLPMHPW